MIGKERGEARARLKDPAAAAPADPPPAAKQPAGRTPVGPPRRAEPAPTDDYVDASPDEDDDDPPNDGKHLLGWARNQPGDAKNWLVGLGKRLRYPNRILDWSPKQVRTAYQTYREAHRG